MHLCPIGACAFYLMARFFASQEFLDFTVDDWLDNAKWFDIKLLVDINSNDFAKEMKNDSYSKHMKKLLKN